MAGGQKAALQDFCCSRGLTPEELWKQAVPSELAAQLGLPCPLTLALDPKPLARYTACRAVDKIAKSFIEGTSPSSAQSPLPYLDMVCS